MWLSAIPLASPYGFLPEGYGAPAAPKKSGGVFTPGYPPEVLWSTPYNKRKVDLTGVVLGPEETIIAVARGMNPGAMINLDRRATIKGGLTALKAVGLSDVDPSRLKVTTLNLPADDKALIRAAGGGRNLKEAAEAVQRRVAGRGPALAKAAWGARGLFILGTLPGFQVGRSIASTVVGIFVPPVGALMAAHGAVTGSVATATTDKMTAYLKEGVAEYQARPRGGSGKTAAPAEAAVVAAPPAPGVPPWLWIGGGVAALAVIGAAVVRRRRSA
jgi:hypothetical protein